MAENYELTITPINDEEYMATKPARWMAALDINGSPAYDGVGETVELALARLIQQMAEAL